MIKTRVVLNASGTRELCETYSTESFKLKQMETGVVYGASVIDTIVSYDEMNNPIAKFHYSETDEYDEDYILLSETELKAQAYDILMGVSE